METSAKSGDNIKLLFRNVATNLPKIDEQNQSRSNEDEENVNLQKDNKQSEQQGWCACFQPKNNK